MVRRYAEKIKNWYITHERPISTAALIGGFIFDAVALKRVDLILENLWILIHLITAAIGILFLNIYETRRLKESVPGRIHFWLLIFIQFSFGGLLSTYLVFYFRSATLATSWPFLLLLTIIFVCNESLKKHYSRLSFQISVLFIATFSFAIYIFPILFRSLDPYVFILSGIGSLIFIFIFILMLQLVSNEKFKQGRVFLYGSIISIFMLINILYFTKLIPPIPLSLKDAGVYHSISNNGNGTYSALSESTNIWDYLRSYSVYHKKAGDPVYVFTAIFSPTRINTDIIHNWQYYNEKQKKWLTVSRVRLSINGGRDGGYRTYSNKIGLTPGSWRVDVETIRGQDIGRIKFKIETASTTPSLQTIKL
jgi:hypothetical protein